MKGRDSELLKNCIMPSFVKGSCSTTRVFGNLGRKWPAELGRPSAATAGYHSITTTSRKSSKAHLKEMNTLGCGLEQTAA